MSKGEDAKTTDIIKWEAEEYVQREKNRGWYIGMIAGGAIIATITFLVGLWSFGMLIIVSVLALVVYSIRPPRMLKYRLTSKGLKEGEKLYEFSNLRAFSIRQTGDHYAIILIPRKRFGARITVYFPEEQGERIVDAFGSRLPMEESEGCGEDGGCGEWARVVVEKSGLCSENIYGKIEESKHNRDGSYK